MWYIKTILFGFDYAMMIFPGCEKKMSFTTDGYAKKGKTIVAEYKKEGE